MSDARLIKALEYGGAVYVERDKSLSVRRTKDARGGIIGTLAPDLFNILVEQGKLKPLGVSKPMRYVWCGEMIERAQPTQASIRTFVEAHSKKASRSLLGLILNALSDRSEASVLRRASEWFYQDHIWESEAGSVAGMNWQSLALGGRIDQSSQPDASFGDLTYRVKAVHRLQKLRAHFSERAYNELYALILSEHGKKHFAATFAFTETEAERRAVDLLRRLSWLYEKDLSPPFTVAELLVEAAS